MADETVYLVPIGRGSFELYTEPADDPAADAPHPDGFFRRTLHQLRERWRRAAHAAAHAPHAVHQPAGRIARARDWLVGRIAESIAEQRTLWSLRGVTAASFIHPADLAEAAAAEVRQRLLAHACTHHGWWLIANLVGVAATAVLALLPGPNVIGYYFLFRVVGHFLSWRGALQGLERIDWTATAEPALTALGALALLPRDQREAEVAALAEGLHLPRLAAFFDRVAVPAR